MTDREKLIELLTDNLPHCDNPMQYTYDEVVERLADHLIANDVTIQKWIPVTERLPEVAETVIALGSRGGVYVAQYTGKRYWHKLNARNHMCEPTHWMPLPEPPKGE